MNAIRVTGTSHVPDMSNNSTSASYSNGRDADVQDRSDYQHQKQPAHQYQVEPQPQPQPQQQQQQLHDYMSSVNSNPECAAPAVVPAAQSVSQRHSQASTTQTGSSQIGSAAAVAGVQDDKDKQRKVRFSVGHDYTVKDVIGEGAYGIVVSAIHKPSGNKVAIKKISPFDHVLFALRTLRELKLLKYFTEESVSDNLITILDIVKPVSYDLFREVYLVQELLETDLHRVIRTQDLSDDHCQYFVYQTCRAIKALHSAEIVHRDLKPSNLLLNANCDLKVCDFGLARSTQTALPASNGANGLMTEYVATRWYRAPEVMLSFKQYTKAIDVWSIGCILAEMLNGRPLFPGKDYHHQLSLILDVLGTPSMEDFYNITSRRSRDYIRALPFRRKQNFDILYKDSNPLAIDFLKKTLTFDPKNRFTVEQCLSHPYLEAYHDPDDEPVAAPLVPGFFDFDLKKDDITREELKQLLYDEIMSFRMAPLPSQYK